MCVCFFKKRTFRKLISAQYLYQFYRPYSNFAISSTGVLYSRRKGREKKISASGCSPGSYITFCCHVSQKSHEVILSHYRWWWFNSFVEVVPAGFSPCKSLSRFIEIYQTKFYHIFSKLWFVKGALGENFETNDYYEFYGYVFHFTHYYLVH